MLHRVALLLQFVVFARLGAEVSEFGMQEAHVVLVLLSLFKTGYGFGK